MTLHRAVVAGFVLSLTTTFAVQAGGINGSQAISAVSLTADSTSLALATQFQVSQVTNTGGSSQTGDYIGYPNTLLGTSTFNVGSYAGYSFGNADFGTFTAASGFEIASPVNTRTFYFLGSFTTGSNAVFTGKTDPTSASFLVSLTQTGGAPNAISWSGTLNTPAISVVPLTSTPEPASVTLAGIGLLSLGLIRTMHRRKSKYD